VTKLHQRLLVLTVLAVVVLLGTAGAAFAGAITVNLHSNAWVRGSYWSHVNPCTVYVYGPSGYYRTQSYGGWNSTAFFTGKTQSYSFPSAPSGAYRVLVAWKSWYIVDATQANQYFTTGTGWFQSPNHTCDFTSP